MNLNDICQIIDDYNIGAFKACRKQLYNVLGFKVLTEHEIRRPELKEKLADFFASNDCAQKSNGNFETVFADLIECNVKQHISAEQENGINKKYKNQELKYLKDMKSGTTKIEVLENTIMIYISQFKIYQELDKDHEYTIRLLDPNNVYYVPKDGVDTAYFVYSNISIKAQYTESVTHGRKKVEETKTIYFTKSEKEFMYVLTVLILYRILQYEGEI